MSSWTSEKIAKALKGSGLSSQERINTATEAWSNNMIFFPNKADFLFDWVCFALSSKPNTKSLLESPLFDSRYWNLLHTLLQHYNDPSTVTCAPTIRVPLLGAVSTVLEHSYTTLRNNSNVRDQLIPTILYCIQLLMTDSAAFHPSLDHMTLFVESLLHAISYQTDLVHARQSAETNIMATLDALLQLSHIMIKRYMDLLNQAGNQKKICTMIITKIMPLDLHVRRQLISLKDEKYLDAAQQFTEMLCHVLFHPDTISEYTSALKEERMDMSKIKNASYVAKLFEELMAMVTKPNDTESLKDAFDVLPILLSRFIKQFRQKRNTMMAPTQDIHRLVEFGFFMQANHILDKGKQRAVSAYLDIESQLLEQVLVLNIYSSRNDPISKQQYDYLNGLASLMVGRLTDEQDCNQVFVLNALNYLLQIDIGLIERHTESIWPVLLQPAEHAESSCLSLARTVLKTYAASRQMDVFVDELLNAIYSAQFEDIFVLLRKPLFSKSFLQEFSLTVAKHVPGPQTLTIFEKFATPLKKQFELRKAAISPEEKEMPQKKRKIFHSPGQFGIRSVTLLTTTYLVEFIRSLRLGQHQRQSFSRAANELFEAFLKPSLCNTMHLEHSLLPALQLHVALSTAFYDVYWLNLSVNSRDWLISELKGIFKLEYQGETQSSRIFLVNCVNALLQHVYFSSLNHDNSSPTHKCSELVSLVLDVIFADKTDRWQQATWDGQLMSLNNMNQVRLAIWKLLTDEWFEPICHVIEGDTKTAQSLVSLVLLPVTQQGVNANQSNIFTMQCLNNTLLRSARIYETKCFHDHSTAMLMDILIDLFQSKVLPNSNGIGLTIVQEIDQVKYNEPFVTDKIKLCELGNILAATLVEKMDIDTEHSHQSVVESVGRIMNLLLLFPIEYYGKQERQYILWLSFLVDAWLLSSAQATPHSIIRASLACRILYLRFMNIIGIIALQSNPSIMQWWVCAMDNKFSHDTKSSLKSDLTGWNQVSKLVDHKVQSVILSMAGNKNHDAQAVSYLQDTLRFRFQFEDTSSKLPPSFQWVLTFMDALVSYLPTWVKKEENVKESDVLDTLPHVVSLSHYISQRLQQSRLDIESLFTWKGKDTLRYSDLANLFYGAKLVLEYARILKMNERDVDISELANSTVAMISPMSSQLKSYSESMTVTETADDLLKMMTSFMGAVCFTLSPGNETNTTKQVLAVIWDVFEMVNETHDAKAIQTAGDVFTTWIQGLSKEQFDTIVEDFVNQMNAGSMLTVNEHGKKSPQVFLSLSHLILTTSLEDQKHRLRRVVPNFILQLTTLMRTKTSIKFLHGTLDLLVHLTNSTAYVLQPYDVSLIISCLLEIINPVTIPDLETQVDRTMAHTIFERIMSVMVHLVRSHRDGLAPNMGTVVTALQSLLLCFKSTQLSLVSQADGITTNKQAPSKEKTSSLPGLFIPHAPLDSIAAERFARVISQLTVKPVGSKRSDVAYYHILRHVPYLLMAYFVVQSDPVTNITLPALKTALSFGWYELLNVSTDTDRALVMAGLNSTGKALFKSFYHTWKTEHKYTGQ